jgi:hypothetical protein
MASAITRKRSIEAILSAHSKEAIIKFILEQGLYVYFRNNQHLERNLAFAEWQVISEKVRTEKAAACKDLESDDSIVRAKARLRFDKALLLSERADAKYKAYETMENRP